MSDEFGRRGGGGWRGGGRGRWRGGGGGGGWWGPWGYPYPYDYDYPVILDEEFDDFLGSTDDLIGAAAPSRPPAVTRQAETVFRGAAPAAPAKDGGMLMALATMAGAVAIAAVPVAVDRWRNR